MERQPLSSKESRKIIQITQALSANPNVNLAATERILKHIQQDTIQEKVKPTTDQRWPLKDIEDTLSYYYKLRESLPIEVQSDLEQMINDLEDKKVIALNREADRDYWLDIGKKTGHHLAKKWHVYGHIAAGLLLAQQAFDGWNSASLINEQLKQHPNYSQYLKFSHANQDLGDSFRHLTTRTLSGRYGTTTTYPDAGESRMALNRVLDEIGDFEDMDDKLKAVRDSLPAFAPRDDSVFIPQRAEIMHQTHRVRQLEQYYYELSPQNLLKSKTNNLVKGVLMTVLTLVTAGAGVFRVAGYYDKKEADQKKEERLLRRKRRSKSVS